MIRLLIASARRVVERKAMLAPANPWLSPVSLDPFPVRLFALVLSMILAGCQPDPLTALYTRKQPKREDLIGKYVPDDATRAVIIKAGGKEPAILVSADGTLTMQNIPDSWLNEFGDPIGGFDSGQPRWLIWKHQDWWVIRVTFDSAEHFAARQHKIWSFGAELFLIGDEPPYKIHLNIGDPYSGRGMDFVRSKI